MYAAERSCSSGSEGFQKRSQSLRCQRPLKASTAAWNPVSRGGAKTGVTAAARQKRMIVPMESRTLAPPMNRASLSNWA